MANGAQTLAPAHADAELLWDLETLARARRLGDWMFEQFAPYVGPEAVEIGAGIGTYSERLLEAGVERLLALEPEAGCTRRLRERFGADPRVTVSADLLPGSPELEARAGRADLVVCQNVLEHIADDYGAVADMGRALRPGGHLSLLVPAHPRLYGPLDAAYGHHRRYTRERLRDVVRGRRAGGDRPLFLQPPGRAGVVGLQPAGCGEHLPAVHSRLRGAAGPVGAGRASPAATLGPEPRRPRAPARRLGSTAVPFAGDCTVCAGPLRPLYRGAGVAPAPALLAPSCHATGAHGDLYRCERCHAVHQPALLAGAPLDELYRAMDDDAYLDEEDGRRATANRLLDLLEPGPPPGRLLDVGCGHGLLLDEARRRGYDAEGIDLSARAAAYARGRLGLTVGEIPLEALGPEEDGRWDVVVVADVLEHLKDPRAAIARLHGLLAPGGALLLVTPDPSSPVARLAGRRWWGYLPAHTILLPRAVLRELVTETGLAIARDVPFVRSFSLGYWLAGLAERSRPVAGAAAAVRRLPVQARLSLSLGDERVVVGRKGSVGAAAEPLVREAAGR